MSAEIVQLRSPVERGSKLQNGNLPPRRRPNAAARSREYLTPDESMPYSARPRAPAAMGTATQR
jgi:hypothetical protein